MTVPRSRRFPYRPIRREPRLRFEIKADTSKVIESFSALARGGLIVGSGPTRGEHVPESIIPEETK